MDRRVFENVIRVRRLLIPFQVSYVVFFAMAVAMLLTILRPPVDYPSYYFSITILSIALVFSAVEVRRAMSRKI